MHDVLNPRDLIPDEAEQLAHSGYPAQGLLADATTAAGTGDLDALHDIARRLAALRPSPGWPYLESDDDETLDLLAAAAPEITVDPAELAGRIHGAWLGRCVGNTMGKPVEGLTRDEVKTYLRAAGQWPLRGYVRLIEPLPAGVSHLHESAPDASDGRFEDVPRDDDIDWTILGLAMLEEHGKHLSTEAIARAWLDRLPFTQTFTAERAAYRNLVGGVPISMVARVENPYREWIGALIRGDIFGYVNPGRPADAAIAARVDARLSHTQNGIFGELWAAALVAAALGLRDAEPALRAALSVIPPRSRLAESQRQLLDLRSSGATADEALDWIDSTLGHYNWVHTVNNAALITLGLLWGEDFVSTVALTISGGRDTDSAGATAGSVYGALHGVGAIPDELVGTTHVRVRSAVRGFDRVEIRELANRTMDLIGGDK
ncbi:ADP-ribosylglycohydrolase family protein [Lysobacter korlensis]|uniref:ADP-ribosylglycohydrolase family protein n=1 Tax=Lysobacter korlensis TaxID=553636 RepID=A0ABV6S268_9GAMM